MSRTAHRVATVEELQADGDRVIEEVAGQEIAVYRLDGELYAIANYCTHQGGPLCEGPTTGRLQTDENGDALEYDDVESVVRCPWHGWRFEIPSGRSLQSHRWSVPTYEVEVRDGSVYVLR